MNAFFDRTTLLVVGLVVSALVLFFFRALGDDALNILLSLWMISMAVDNHKLRKQLKRLQSAEPKPGNRS